MPKSKEITRTKKRERPHLMKRVRGMEMRTMTPIRRSKSEDLKMMCRAEIISAPTVIRPISLTLLFILT